MKIWSKIVKMKIRLKFGFDGKKVENIGILRRSICPAPELSIIHY